jgi:hypothetical protein
VIGNDMTANELKSYRKEDDFFILASVVSDSIISIANPKNYPVNFIVKTIEDHFSINGNYTLFDKGADRITDTSTLEPLFTKFNINFDEYCFSNLLKKYFSA